MAEDKKISEESILTRDGTERIPVIQSDGSGGYVNGALEIDSLDTNIYNTDGALPTGATRTFNLDTGKLSLTNGQIGIGVTPPIPNFRLFVSGNETVGNPSNGIFLTATNNALHAQSNNGLAVAMHSSIGPGFASYSPWNYLRKISTGTLPTAEPTSIFDVYTTDQGSRPVPRLTEAERDVIASPADYIEIVNTTRERKEFYHPFFGWHPVGIITPDWGYWWIDEATGSSSEFIFSATNGGLLTTLIDPALSPTRLAGLSTGVNTNGEYRQITGPYLLGSTGIKSWTTKVSFDNLSNATNRYVSRSGYVNNSAGLSTSIGMYFLYDEGGVYGTLTASANWLCVCFSSGSPVVVDSGIPVSTTSASLQKLTILDHGTGNNVEFYINGSLVATITTQIPTNAQTMSVGNIITKQSGTTARIMYDDYVDAKEKFNTPR